MKYSGKASGCPLNFKNSDEKPSLFSFLYSRKDHEQSEEQIRGFQVNIRGQ